MIAVKGITVSVDYADILAVTLPKNLRYFKECMVVTSLEDSATKEVAFKNGCPVFCTDAFTRHGAKFNKGLALHEVFEFLNLVQAPPQWVLGWDADILLPEGLGTKPTLLFGRTEVVNGNLYSCPRRILKDAKAWHEGLDWTRCMLDCRNQFAGYFQLFCTGDPALQVAGGAPWHDVTFAHAGGGDGFFQSRWPRRNKAVLPFEVLHLGPIYRNWCGRNDQAAMWDLHRYWQQHREAAEHERYGVRVEVPGHTARKWVHGRHD